jgi:DNA-directed RNA polymerase subunit RPC12/RpoP
MTTEYSIYVCATCGAKFPAAGKCPMGCKPLTEERVREIARDEIAANENLNAANKEECDEIGFEKAQEIRDSALEEAARVCGLGNVGQRDAESIRALKSHPAPSTFHGIPVQYEQPITRGLHEEEHKKSYIVNAPAASEEERTQPSREEMMRDELKELRKERDELKLLATDRGSRVAELSALRDAARSQLDNLRARLNAAEKALESASCNAGFLDALEEQFTKADLSGDPWPEHNWIRAFLKRTGRLGGRKA